MAVEDPEDILVPLPFEIPTGAVPQPTERHAADQEGKVSHSFSWKGNYAELCSAADLLAVGDELPSPNSGWFAQTWQVERTKGGLGVLTVNAVPADETTSGESPSAVPFKDVWSIKSVRNDVSVMAYCGETPGGPQRVIVEKWLRETDREVALAGNYRENGAVVDVATEYPGSAELIAKMMKGVETVMRFYPLVTRKRHYYAPPADVLENVGFIDAPPTPAANARAAGGLNAKLALYQWLKCQDDCDQQPDQTWIRTESWMGVLKSDGQNDSPIDPDLYGTNRWSMPHLTGENQAVNSNANGGSS